MSSPKKKASTLILGSMSPLSDAKEAPKTEDGAESDDSIGMHSAADELIAAVHAKDPKGVATAMKALHEMCSSEESEPSMEEEVAAAE